MDSLDLKKIKILKKKNSLNDVVGVHISSEAIALIRLRSVAGVVTISDAECFAHDTLVKDKSNSINNYLPVYLKSKYAAVTYESENAIIKLLNFPRVVESRTKQQIASDLGVSDVDKYRMGLLPVTSDNKSESSFIEVALPVEELMMVNDYFSMHIPAASSISIAHLSAINAYADFLKKSAASGVSAVLNIEEDSTVLFVFNDLKLIFLRMFRTGMRSLTEEIADLMGVSKKAICGIICENAFDVSKQVEVTLKPFTHKINLSLDFVERKEETVIEKVYLSGNSEIIVKLIDGFQNFLMPEVKLFDPFTFYSIGEDAFKNFDDKRWCYATAFGAALGLLEEGQ